MHRDTKTHIQNSKLTSQTDKLNPKGAWLCNCSWIAGSLCSIMATIRLKAVSFQYQSGCNEGWMTLGKGTIEQILRLINVADVRNMNWIFSCRPVDVNECNNRPILWFFTYFPFLIVYFGFVAYLKTLSHPPLMSLNSHNRTNNTRFSVLLQRILYFWTLVLTSSACSSMSL